MVSSKTVLCVEFGCCNVPHIMPRLQAVVRRVGLFLRNLHNLFLDEVVKVHHTPGREKTKITGIAR